MTTPPSQQQQRQQQHRQRTIRYRVTGSAANDRIVPLLPPDWVEVRPRQDDDDDDDDDDPPLNFLWENAPRRDARRSRENVRCYSHLPNGTAVLDSKWALARLMADDDQDEDDDDEEAAVLETHCLRGADGLRDFAERIGLTTTTTTTTEEEAAATTTGFLDLAHDRDATNAAVAPTAPPPPKNLWVLKDARANGAGGVWVLSSATLPDLVRVLETTAPLDAPCVAQRYAWPPALFRGRKCHARAYALLTSDGRVRVHDRAFLHAANRAFDVRRETDDEVQLTNCCANDGDPDAFAGEISASFAPNGRDDDVVDLSPYRRSVDASVRRLARRAAPLVTRGGERVGGFEYLGLDFALSSDGSTAWLLEVNAPPSQDTATGLPRAEAAHDEVLGDLLRLWVLPRVTPETREEEPGGWRCVWRDKESSSSSSTVTATTTTSTITPSFSKAVLLNRMRWVAYERRAARRCEERRTRQESPSSSPTDAAVVAADRLARRARARAPYFRRFPERVFCESAGGAQVSDAVVRAVRRSLSRRHRDVVGRRDRERAERTLRALVGAPEASHALFLGANASTLLRALASVVEMRAGDNVVASNDNHDANAAPWAAAAERAGAETRWRDGTDDAEVDERTVVAALSHASNVTGALRRDLAATAREIVRRAPNALVVVDGVAAAPHRYAGLSAADHVHAYVLSCHKAFGPHLGALFVRRGSPIEARLRKLPRGTVSYEACAGVRGVGDYLRSLGTTTEATVADARQNVRERASQTTDDDDDDDCDSDDDYEPLTVEDARRAYRAIKSAEAVLARALRDGLRRSSPHVTVVGDDEDDEDRLPLASVVHARLRSDDVVQYLRDEHDIICRSGTFLSPRALRSTLTNPDKVVAGETGVVRFSLAHYNTTDEVRRVLDALDKMEGWK